MATDISSLPPELLHHVLTYLPMPALLAFGQTSRYHHEAHLLAFHKLRLGVFPTRVNGMLTLFNAVTAADAADDAPYDTAHSVQLVLDRKKSRTKDAVIRHQNRTIAGILQQHGRRLRDVDLSLWALEAPAAAAIASLPQLRHLALRLDHPHTRHRDVPASFWKSAAPSTVWNALYTPRPGSPAAGGAAEPRPVLGRLVSLQLDRAGITDYQLRRICQDNTRTLREIRLRKCSELTAAWWAWLAASPLAAQLEVLHFTYSQHEEIDARILPHIQAFVNLKSFSLLGCSNIEDSEVHALNESTWHFPRCTPPQCSSAPVAIEVDPAYK